MTTLTEVKAAQPEWFSRKNKRFFGDVSYRVLYGKASGNHFLVRSTYAWTDMFDRPRKLPYRINVIHEDLKIGPLLDEVFDSLPEVKQALKAL